MEELEREDRLDQKSFKRRKKEQAKRERYETAVLANADNSMNPEDFPCIADARLPYAVKVCWPPL